MRDSCTLTGVFVMIVAATAAVPAQQPAPAEQEPRQQNTAKDAAPQPDYVFDLGKIVGVGSVGGRPAVGGAVVTREQIWSFDRKSLDHAVNVVPGVVSTFDSNGRRNESDIFVRGFGRRVWIWLAIAGAT